jgi:hypothetical protein
MDMILYLAFKIKIYYKKLYIAYQAMAFALGRRQRTDGREERTDTWQFKQIYLEAFRTVAPQTPQTHKVV